jgi:hypothetical protein
MSRLVSMASFRFMALIAGLGMGTLYNRPFTDQIAYGNLGVPHSSAE